MERHVANTPLAVVEWDPDFCVASVNARAEALFGWSAAELVGRRIDEVPWVAGADWPSVQAVMADMRSGARPSNVNRNANLTRDGRRLECEWHNSALYDPAGRLSSVLSLVLDVTAQRTAEAALRESRDRLALFIDHAPAAIAMLDRELRYLAASRRYLADYQLGQVDYLGRSHYELFPEIPERWREIHRRCLAGAVERATEDRFDRSDGRVDWVDWEIRPWRDAAGAIGGLLLFSEVVTARKAMQARAARGERLTAVATLVRGLSHEVNSPLAGVLTNVEYAQQALRRIPQAVRAAWSDEAPLEELQNALGDASHAAARIGRIVREMNAFLPRPPGPDRWCEPAQAAALAVQAAAPALARCAEVRVDVPAELPVIALDLEEVVQLLANLLGNAGLATGASPNLVDLTARERTPGRVTFSIRDTGVGMAPEVLDRVLEPFFTTRDVGQGRGLGIPQCHGILESAGGELAFESAPGVGTTATAGIPVAAP